MERTLVVEKAKELAHKVLTRDDTVINQAEIAVIMTTFGITWDEIKSPTVFSPSYEMVRTEGDLRREFERTLNTLVTARQKGLYAVEYDTKLMLQGFIQGVRFFDDRLASEFSHLVYKVYH